MASSTRRIVTNTFWLSGAEGVNFILNFIAGILIVRYLGDARYGQLGFAQSFVALFAIFTDFGWSALMINEVSRDRAKLAPFLNNLISIKIFMGLATTTLIIGILWFSNKQVEVKSYVYVLAAGMVISAIAGTLSAVFRIFQVMRYEAILRTAGIVLAFLTTIWVIWQKQSLLLLLILSMLVGVLSLVATTWFVRARYFKFRITFDRKFIWSALKQAFPLGISAVFVSIYYYLDTVILSFTKTDEVVGWYTAAYRLLLILLTFMGLYFAALFPELSKIISTDLERARNLSRLSLRALGILTLPIAVGTIFVGKAFLGLVYGSSFRAGGTALTILIWSVPVIAVGSIYGNLLLAKAERKTQMLGVGIGAALNVALNFLLIPKFSLVGAAVATLAAELWVLGFFYWQTKKKVTYIPFMRTLTKPFIAAVLMGAVLLILPPLHVLTVIGIGAVSYTTLLFFFRAVTMDEVRLVLNLVRNRA